jgi:pimeloyl-ACP methyl ester carboxylesterase
MGLETVDWYDVCGPEEAPAVILIHGSTLTRASWKPQVDALQADYRLICPDLPAHGTLAALPFHLDTALERLGALFERECGPNGRAVLVGISLGGHIATLLAASHPRQTAGLVISGASMNFSGLTGLWTKTIGLLMGRLNPEKMRAQAERNIRKKWPAESAEAIIAAGIYPMGAFQSFR